MMPHIQVVAVQEINLQIDLAMLAGIMPGVRQWKPRGQGRRDIDRSLLGTRIDQSLGQLPSYD
jgi:hypothetical protein